MNVNDASMFVVEVVWKFDLEASVGIVGRLVDPKMCFGRKLKDLESKKSKLRKKLLTLYWLHLSEKMDPLSWNQEH